MKKIILFICMFFVMSFSSCIVGEYATTQDDLYYGEPHAEVVHTNVDINFVIAHGTPYYYNGALLYYIYNGLYYYPFYYDNYWYMRVYTRPFDHLRYRPYFRPHRYDYRFNRDFHYPHDWRSNPARNHNRFGAQPDRRHLENRPIGRPSQQHNPPQARPQQGQIRHRQRPTQQRSIFGGSRGTTQSAPSRGMSTPTPRSSSSSGRSGGSFGGRR